jgi:hypothetical protein
MTFFVNLEWHRARAMQRSELLKARAKWLLTLSRWVLAILLVSRGI